MESELGVLMALLLGRTAGYEGVANALLGALSRNNDLPRRLTWEGQEEPWDAVHFDKVCKNLPSDFLVKMVEYVGRMMDGRDRFDGGSGGATAGFEMGGHVLSVDVYNRISNRKPCGRMGVRVAEEVMRRAMGVSWRRNLGSPPYQHVKTITGHFLPVYCVHFDHGEQRMVTAGDDGVIRVWCLQTGLLVGSIRGHTACICDLSVDPRNKVMASCSLDETVQIWDLATGAPLLHIATGSPVLTVEFHPRAFEDGRHGILMAACSDGFLRLWTIDLRRKLASSPPVKYYCRSLVRDSVRLASFSPAGTRIVTGATDGIVRMVRVPGWEEVARGDPIPVVQPQVLHLEGHEGYINCAQYGKDGTELVTAAWDGRVLLWQYDRMAAAWTSRAFGGGGGEGRREKVTMTTFACDDQLILAATTADGHVIRVYTRTGTILQTFPYHQGEIQILTCHPTNSALILSAAYDGSVAVWEAATGRIVYATRFPCKFLDGAWSPSGDYFALTDELGRVSLFATGVSPDTFKMAPSVQLLPSDWMEPLFDAGRRPLDPITGHPPIPNPIQTVGLERHPNPIHTARSFHLPLVHPYTSPERQQELERQVGAEGRLFQLELELADPMGIPPRTSRRRRAVYGSDTEEQLDGGGELMDVSPARPQVEQATVDVESDSSDSVSVRRSSRRVRPAIQEEEEVIDDGEDLYRPNQTTNTRRHRRSAQTIIGPPAWLSIDDRRQSPLLPQLYDTIAYFPQGHRAFLEQEHRVAFHQHQVPREIASRQMVIAQIVRMAFLLEEEQPYALLTLLPLPDGVEEDFIGDAEDPAAFQLAYYDREELPDFIILASRYHTSIQHSYSVGQQVRVLYGHQESYTGRIVRARRRGSAWQCYTVQWLDLDDPPEDCSPWELEPLDNGSLGPSELLEQSIPVHVLRTLADGLAAILASRHALHLSFPVDYRSFPDYLLTIPYPMYLDLIRRRLQNGFYRRIQALSWDAALIPHNALLYNLPDSPIVRDANAVLRLLEALIHRAQRPPRLSAVSAISILAAQPPAPPSEPPSKRKSRSAPIQSDTDSDPESESESDVEVELDDLRPSSSRGRRNEPSPRRRSSRRLN